MRKHFLCKREALSLSPRTKVKKPSALDGLVIPTLGMWRQVDPRGAHEPTSLA